MKFISAAALVSLAALASAQLDDYELTPEQSSVIGPISSKLSAIAEHSAYPSFASALETAQMEFAATQTIFPVDATATSSEVFVSYFDAFASVNNNFVATQTIITGDAKTTFVEVQSEFLSFVRSVGIESLTASGSDPEETASTSFDGFTSAIASELPTVSTRIGATLRTASASPSAVANPSSGAMGLSAGGLVAGVVAGVAAVVAMV